MKPTEPSATGTHFLSDRKRHWEIQMTDRTETFDPQSMEAVIREEWNELTDQTHRLKWARCLGPLAAIEGLGPPQ